MNKLFEFENLKVEIEDKIILDIEEKIVFNQFDVIGVIGENGAGKTTLINAILGEVPYDGQIKRYFNKDEIGIQFQKNEYNELLKVYELIQIVKGVRKFDDKLKEEIQHYNLDKILNTRINKISGGELQRLTLFLLLTENSNFYIFDELTTGLDFKKRNKLLNIVHKKTEEKTVLIVTHYFEELLNWVSKLLILYKGKLVFFGSMEELEQKYDHRGILKVEKESDCLTNKNVKNISFNEHYNEYVIFNEEQEEELIKVLENKNIDYDKRKKNIYSLYNMAISKFKEVDKNAE